MPPTPRGTGPFDRRDPLPRATLHDIAVTGAGQASQPRLWTAGAMAAAVSTALVLTGHRWLLPWPVALGAFAAYGLAMKATHRLDVRQRAAPLARRALTAAAAVAVAVAVLALAAAVVLLVGRGLGWDPVDG